MNGFPMPSPPTPSSPGSLLASGDPPPFHVVGERAPSEVLLIGDHAGNVVPLSLGDLGVSAGDRTRHIAWDIGIRALGETLAPMLDATFIWQPFSRLVIDCNREPRQASAMPEISDATAIPGNVALADGAREARRAAIHQPYHQRIADEIAARQARGMPTVLIALHSFTPVMANTKRPWHLGVLHDAGDTSLSQAMLRRLQREPGLVVGDNEPYRMDRTDYTVPRHAYPANLPYLEIEFRQDLLADAARIERWAGRFASWLRDALVER